VVEEDVGNTSALDVTPPEADTLKVPFAYVVKKANGVEEYWAVKARYGRHAGGARCDTDRGRI